MAEQDPSATNVGETEAENSVRPSKRRRPEPNQPAAANASPPQSAASKPAHAVPDEVRRRFVQVKNRYYFPDGARAFTDRGTRLTTPSENTEVVRSLILIAEARGWSEVTVRGTERFRREAWLAAKMTGIEVRGYKPTEFERARVVRALNRQGPGPTEDSVTPGERPVPAEPEKRSRQSEELLVGRIPLAVVVGVDPHAILCVGEEPVGVAVGAANGHVLAVEACLALDVTARRDG